MPSARSVFGWTALTAALAVLLGLGTWQMARRAEKHDLISRIQTRMAAPPTVLPDSIADPSAWDYRRVVVRGRFLHDKEMLLSGRAHRGVAGYHVVTPLARADAPAVLVDRGWVPAARASPASRAEGQVTGPVTVAGIARAPASTGAFTPANDPGRGFWITPDPAAMARHAGLGPVPGLVVEADASPLPGGLPLGGVSRVALTDNHLQYALTWYSLALVLVAVVAAYRRRRKRFPDS